MGHCRAKTGPTTLKLGLILGQSLTHSLGVCHGKWRLPHKNWHSSDAIGSLELQNPASTSTHPPASHGIRRGTGTSFWLRSLSLCWSPNLHCKLHWTHCVFCTGLVGMRVSGQRSQIMGHVLNTWPALNCNLTFLLCPPLQFTEL